MKIFLDTSLLSDAGLSQFAEEIAERVAAGSAFYVSAVTHFQLLWGYSTAGMTPGAYEAFLEATKAEVVPLTKVDAAGWKAEADGVAEFYGKFGAKLPAALKGELENLKKRLG